MFPDDSGVFHSAKEVPMSCYKGSFWAGSSIGFGAILAMIMSWTANKSVILVLFHAILGWIYVIYYLITHHDWTWF